MKRWSPANTYYGLAVTLWLVFLIGAPALYGTAHAWVRIGAYFGALGGVLLLLMGFGTQIVGKTLGVLAASRNAYSLSRLQMVLWTWLVLSALMAVAACQGWGAGGASAASALYIYIPNNLFVVMGISYFTGAAAPALLSLKTGATPTSGQLNDASLRMGERVSAVGQVVVRPQSADPKLADLVQGDDLASAGAVDLSKVQQLLVTGVLIATYAAMLFQVFAGDVFPSQVFKVDGKDVSMTPLPDFSPQLLTLLAVSHGGYLAYKAAPRTAPSTNLTQPWAPPPLNS